MSEKSTALKALERIKKHFTEYDDNDEIKYIYYENELNIIEKELKRFNRYKKLADFDAFIHGVVNKIFRGKVVIWDKFVESKTVEEYNAHVDDVDTDFCVEIPKHLTEFEFEFLKGELL